jgi:hypothetical protein
VIRSMTDIGQASLDIPQRTLAVRGKAGPVALAEWLFYELDKPTNPQALAQPSPNSATHEYRLSDGGEDVVRVFYLKQPKTRQDLQEIATVVRSMADIRRLFTYSASMCMVLRGTAVQIALSEWLISELDKPAIPQAVAQQSPNPAAHEYRPSGTRDDVARVFYLTHSQTPQRLQEIATQVRSMTELRRLFTCNAPRALALRGTAGQIALADRLIEERDR